jgi:predicted enzyme related to lactoylglutathione lyase
MFHHNTDVRQLAAAAATGGSAPIPPFDTPYGRMAGLTDPAGVSFWIVDLAVGDSPE